MRASLVPLLVAVYGLSGCATQGAQTAGGREAVTDFDRTPRDCISITRISRTEVIDERTILFYMSGREVFRNSLPDACPGLNRREPFMYEPRALSPQLCDTDNIDLLQRFGSGYERGRACNLGKFYPMTPEDVADLKRTGPSAVQVEPAEAPPAQPPQPQSGAGQSEP